MSRAVVLVLTGLLAAIAATALAWSAAAALQQEPEVRRGEPVTICHETGNGKWVLQSPDADSIVSEHGHGSHPGDIIPPFDYPPSGQDEGGSYPGQNYGEQGRRSCSTGASIPSRPTPRSSRSATPSSASTTSQTARSPQRSATATRTPSPWTSRPGLRTT